MSLHHLLHLSFVCLSICSPVSHVLSQSRACPGVHNSSTKVCRKPKLSWPLPRISSQFRYVKRSKFKVKERKGKERKSIYIAPFCTTVHTKRSGMDHTVLPANNTMPAFPSWRSPDVTTAATEAADIQLELTTHLSTPKG